MYEVKANACNSKQMMTVQVIYLFLQIIYLVRHLLDHLQCYYEFFSLEARVFLGLDVNLPSKKVKDNMTSISFAPSKIPRTFINIYLKTFSSKILFRNHLQLVFVLSLFKYSDTAYK